MKAGQITNISAAQMFGTAEDAGIGIAVQAQDKAKSAQARLEAKKADGNISVSGAAIGEHSVEARKQLARKQAMRVVADAFDAEDKLDEDTKKMSDAIHRLQEDYSDRKVESQENEKILAALREEYGIDENSEEEKGLRAAAVKTNSKNGLSDEDYNNLTEYQKRALYYTASNMKHERAMAEDQADMNANVQARTDLDSARAKSRDMQKAQKNADELMAAADKDAVAMLTQEAMEHIDDKAEEEKEKAEEKAEEEKEAKKKAAKKLEQEAQTQETIARIKESASEAEVAAAKAGKASARRMRDDANSTDAIDSASDVASQSLQMEMKQTEVSSEVTNILNKLSLLTEDVKGARIDDVL